MSGPLRRTAFFVVLATFVLAASLVVAGSATGAGTGSTYLVLYKQQGVPTDASASIAQAGGIVVQGTTRSAWPSRRPTPRHRLHARPGPP